ncbi:MAG: hypothetical protein NTX86_04110 [Candidatus Dependentiae bacterium]|nr:hypothetical protein [Candidatus Dependentiae bacterium]
MISKKQVFFLVLSCLLVNGVDAKTKKSKKAQEVKQPTCSNEKDCTNMKKPCQCYCSVKCGYRKKMKSDRPVYVENDPTGINCWCKEWDKKNYKNNECDLEQAE